MIDQEKPTSIPRRCPVPTGGSRSIRRHGFVRAPVARMLWRLAELSPSNMLIEAAVWTGRAMAAPCEVLSFLPLGRHGRAVRGGGGPPGIICKRICAALEISHIDMSHPRGLREIAAAIAHSAVYVGASMQGIIKTAYIVPEADHTDPPMYLNWQAPQRFHANMNALEKAA